MKIKIILACLIVVLSNHLSFAQDGGPYDNDSNTILLMHFNNNISFEGSYTGNISNWGNNPLYENSMDGFDESYRINNSSALQCITMDVTEELNLGNDWTVEFWTKVGSYGSDAVEYPTIFIKDGDGVSAIVIGFRNDGLGFNCGVTLSTNDELRIEQETGIDLEKWYHIALVSSSENESFSFIIHDEDWNPFFKESRSFPAGSDGTLISAERQVLLGGVDGGSNIQYDGWIDELRISNVSRDFSVPLPPLQAQSTYIDFYCESDKIENWDIIFPEIDNIFLELCSYWDRPGLSPLFEEGERVKIYLVAKNDLNNLSGSILPDWKYGSFGMPNELYVALPPGGENDIYEGSFSNLVKNTLAQLVVEKKELRDNYANGADYFLEAFGLYYSGYRPDREKIMEALNDLGRKPRIDDIKNIDDLASTYKKDLIVSYIEAQVLSSIGIQNVGFGGAETHWNHHFKYYYENEEADRIMMRKQTTNFDFYCTEQDIQFLDDISNKLEEKLNHYSTLFEFPIYHRFNCVIYPSSSAGVYCMVVMDDYNGGSGWSGDKLDILSPLEFSGGLEEALAHLIPHEFFHVFHFNMVEHLFRIESFHSEGMAEVMAYEGENDGYLNSYYWYFRDGLERFINENGRDPSLADIMPDADNYMSVYTYGQAFWYYMIQNYVDYKDITEFFVNNRDWNVFDVSYEEIDKRYIDYLKTLARLSTSNNDCYSKLPNDFELQQNFPNPFNPTTTIVYGIPKRTHVKIIVYDEIGQEICVLINGIKDAGYHNVIFDASSLSSGVYFCRMQSKEHAFTKKILLVK